MPGINRRRVLLGALVAGIVWFLWSWAVNAMLLGEQYRAATSHFLPTPRYPFVPIWGVICLVMAYVMAWLYAVARGSLGAGPKTALCVGFAVGFLMSFPHNFATASWSTVDRAFPLWWTVESWVGAMVASLVAGWLYKD